MTESFQADIDRIARIQAVPTILEVVCRTTGMGFAAVARVTDGRWIACSVLDDIHFGLKPGGELQVDTTICHEIRQSREPVVIDHVALDAIYCNHPTPAMYGFQSYISVPIFLVDGAFFGTLCAIDPRPARLRTPETLSMFRLFAELIASHLDSDARLAASEAGRLEERATSELREQFIAVLGHDLRNPVTAILSGARLLRNTPLNDRAAGVVDMMQDTATRMSGLIDDVLDFARGRLGDGVTIERVSVLLEPVLQTIVAEQRIVTPDRVIETNFALENPVACDPRRIGQLFANLVANAVAYGDKAEPVRISAVSAATGFELSVANTGTPISAAVLERLFQPFSRGTEESNRQGLGLGLYIAAQIARAHDGALTAASTPEETRFLFRLPSAIAG